MNTIARKTFSIHGGIHPAENKTQSLNGKIQRAAIPAELILPLAQSIGNAAEPLVNVGDKVLKGQCIAKASSAVSAQLHAPTSGHISAIEERDVPHASGMREECICIRSDGEDQWQTRTPCPDWRALPADTLLKKIRAAGIVGLGGAGFPTDIKLQPPSEVVIDTLIINATECEPYITADHILIRERSEEVLQGVDIIASLLNCENILIGIEDNKADATAALQQALGDRPYEIVVFPTKYPSGGEKQLIEILTGKQVPSGGLPAQLGIVCQNVGTCYAIKRAIVDDEPLISRITTVTGASVEPGNYEVLLGTPMRALLEQAAWRAEQSARLVMGGPMMGFTLHTAEVPVIKTTNCILAPTEEEIPSPAPAQACIRCALCAEVCPASLLPQQLYWFARAKEYEKLEAHNLADCIECGACSYVCPSKIPLVQYYRASKGAIRHRDEEHHKAEQSRERFEARVARLEAAEAEKEARRQARKEAAAKRKQDKSGGKQAEIDAALARVKAKQDSDSQTGSDQ